MIPLIKLNAANRRVHFVSSDGETINAIKDGIKVVPIVDSTTVTDITSVPSAVEFTFPSANISLENNKLYLCNCDLGTARISIKGASDDFKYAQIKFRSDEGIPTSLDSDIPLRTAGDSIQEGKRHTITFAKIDNELVAYIETM